MAALITEIIDCNRRLLEPALAILQGSPTAGFLHTDVIQLKEYIGNQLQIAPLSTKPGLDPNAFKLWTNISGDPDTDLAEWLVSGPPLEFCTL